MNVGIVGGGINGLMVAWSLIEKGHNVTIYEKKTLMKATSSASTKLLHGGIRYLEHGSFRLVREALRERRWWLDFAPELTKPQPILFPIYKNSRRSKWLVGLGVLIYDLLAGHEKLGQSKWLSPEETLEFVPELNLDGLLGAWKFYDAMMDDYQLGIKVASLLVDKGLDVQEHSPVESVATDGTVTLSSGTVRKFDKVINVAGPWATKLLKSSNIKSRYDIDFVRGSHLLLSHRLQIGLIMEYLGESRIFFALPYKNAMLLGTTEVRQDIMSDEVKISDAECEYLMSGLNHYLKMDNVITSIVDTFSGVRPLIKSSLNPTKATREYAFEKNGNLISVFGGKWTTSRVLGNKATELVN